MRRRYRAVIPWMVLILALCAALPAARAQTQPAKTSELHGGRWVDVAAPSNTQEAVDPSLLRIEQMLRDGQSHAAIKQTIVWLKANKTSPLRDRALYLEAEALYQYGNRLKAFFYLDELLDEYPESALYYQALDKQFQIAEAYLSGYKRRFMKIPMFGAQEEAVEMMFRIQQRSPGSPLAEKALLRTSDYYYANADYDLAADAYAAYARSYPRSPSVPRVKLRQAYANLAQFRGLRFDATPVIDAKTQLQEVVQRYPDLAAQENIPAIVDRIDSTLARKLAVTADFYKRTHEPRAAWYTYDYLVKTYPEDEAAAQARTQMAKLGATTQPSGK